MKKLFLLSVPAILLIASSFAQNVGIGTTTPNANAALEIKATGKGLLIPRTSTTTRTAIVNPAKGLMVYDTTTSSFWFHNGSVWTQIETSGKGWLLTGNTGTNPATNFIGTKDGAPLLFKVNNAKSGYIDSGALYTYNTSFGFRALDSVTTGKKNVAIGYNALISNTTGGNNTATGSSSLYSNTTGSSNNANGSQALYYNTTGTYNTADGALSLYQNTTGSENTANGFAALFENTTGYNNTASGYYALDGNSTGYNNTAVGFFSLRSNSIGIYNTAVGSGSMLANTYGGYNTAIGANAMYSNTTGYTNTADGENALYYNTTGGDNTAIGENALVNNTNGGENTAIGTSSLKSTTGSSYNTVVGFNSGSGYNMGYNNTILGANCDINADGLYNCISIGQGVICTASSQAIIGNSATNYIGGYANWTNISDGRYKKEVKENVKGLEFIMKLRPVTYHLDAMGISNKLNESRGREMNEQQKKAITEKEQIVQTGFIAQEVEKAANETGYDFSGVYKPKNENDFYGLRYSEMVVPLVKAVQEQQQVIEDLKSEMAEMKKEIESLKKRN